MTDHLKGKARAVRNRLLVRAPATGAAATSAPPITLGIDMIEEPDDAAVARRLDAVRALSEALRGQRDSIDDERRLPDDVVAGLHEASLSTMLLPRRFGGDGLPLLAGVRVVEEIAALDGSAGWNSWVIVGHGRTAEHMSEQAARKVFGESRRTIAGSLTPTGRAERVTGGYRLTGRWPFGSATSMADYIQTGGFVFERDRPVRRPGGDQLQLGLIVPAADCTVLDTWHTTGLRGTASNDIVVNDVFVPDWMTFDEQRMWQPLDEPGVEFGRPYDEFSPPLMGAVAVGIALDALGSFVDFARAKSRTNHPDWASRVALVHDTVGRARVRIDGARAYLHAVVGGLDGLAPGAPSAGIHTKAAAAHVVQECIAAVDSLYEAGGGSSIYRSSRIERCFRDVHMVSHHMLVAQRTFGDRGRAELDFGA